ncbi:7199_t:CDS:1, partial [Acaulospora morrowiae]
AETKMPHFGTEMPTQNRTEVETVQNLTSVGGRPKAEVWQYYNQVNNGKGRHKGAICKFCREVWNRGRAQEMKYHTAIKCKGPVPRDVRFNLLREIQNGTDSTLPELSTPSTPKRQRTFNQKSLTLDAYYDTTAAIDQTREIRANKA